MGKKIDLRIIGNILHKLTNKISNTNIYLYVFLASTYIIYDSCCFRSLGTPHANQLLPPVLSIARAESTSCSRSPAMYSIQTYIRTTICTTMPSAMCFRLPFTVWLRMVWRVRIKYLYKYFLFNNRFHWFHIYLESRQSHTTICVIDQHLDGTHVLRALKQKMFVDGLCYLLQEIYGIENKNLNKVSFNIIHFKRNLHEFIVIFVE